VGRLEEVGGRTALVEMVEDVATTSHVVSYARNVQEDASRRRIIELSGRLIAVCQDRTQPLESAQRVTVQLMRAVATPRTDDPGMEHLLSQEIDLILSRKTNTKSGEYLTTSIRELDEKVVGLFKGEMTIIGGPPSMGKTSFAVGIAIHNCVRGARILFLSLDQPPKDIHQRMITFETGIARDRLVHGELSAKQRRAIEDFHSLKTCFGGLSIPDDPPRSILGAAALARSLKRANGLDCIIVDYVQAMRSDNRNDQRAAEMERVSNDLKELGIELNVAVVALAQLSRKYENLGPKDLPTATMLKESPALEQDANLILFPWVPKILMNKQAGHSIQEDDGRTGGRDDGREEYWGAVFKIDKHKTGPTGLVRARFHLARSAFFSMTDPHEGRILPLVRVIRPAHREN